MNVKLAYSTLSDVSSQCLVLVVLDHNASKEKDAKPEVTLAYADNSLNQAVAEVIASGDVTGKSLETTLVHSANGAKSKRLLLVGGGKAAKFSADELRKIAGTAVRFAKTKNLKSLAIAVPKSAVVADTAVRALVEGAFVGDFDPNYYQSDRRDQRMDELTIV